MQGVKRILGYLKGSKDLGIHIKPCTTLIIQGFTDADYANCIDDIKSTIGCIYLGKTLF